MLFLETLSQSNNDYCTSQKQEYKKMFKKISEIQWIAENKWFMKQSYDRQSYVLQNMQNIGVNLSKLDTKTLVQVYYTMMLHQIENKTENKTDILKLVLPVRTYSILISHIYQKQNNIHILEKISLILLHGIVKQIVNSPLLFHRGHILIFYEKMYSVLLNITSSTGSQAFQCFIRCLVNMQKHMRNHVSGYRINMFKKIYTALIISVFKSLCIHEHLEDMDYVFALHRVKIHFLDKTTTNFFNHFR